MECKVGDIVVIKTKDFLVKEHYAVCINKFLNYVTVKLLILEPNKERFLEQEYTTSIMDVKAIINDFKNSCIALNSNACKLLKLQSNITKLQES